LLKTKEDAMRQTSTSSPASAGISEKAHALGLSGHFPVKALGRIS
jgi:hypothetical protein